MHTFLLEHYLHWPISIIFDNTHTQNWFINDFKLVSVSQIPVFAVILSAIILLLLCGAAVFVLLRSGGFLVCLFVYLFIYVVSSNRHYISLPNDKGMKAAVLLAWTLVVSFAWLLGCFHACLVNLILFFTLTADYCNICSVLYLFKTLRSW